jgi:hypothetical protein
MVGHFEKAKIAPAIHQPRPGTKMKSESAGLRPTRWKIFQHGKMTISAATI